MKKIHLLGLSLVSVSVLASCGQLVGALVPPQTITNPAGLTGATLTPSGALMPESVGASVRYSTQDTGSSFDDFKFPDNVPFGIRPHGVAFNTSFASATVSGVCAAPDSATVTLKSATVTVKDASTTATLTVTPGYKVVLTKTSQGLGTASYSAASSSALVFSADSVTSDAIVKVLTTGGRNDASLDTAISADQNGLAGCTLSFKLGETTATLSNFS